MNILAFPRASIAPFIRAQHLPFTPDQIPQAPVFAPRPQLEEDPNFVQLIAYAILRHRDDSVWTYQRTGGDSRLHGRKSVGVGGHVDDADNLGDTVLTARAALIRELTEELQIPPPAVPELPIGWISEQESAVGRVHIGLVWDIPWPDDSDPLPAHGEALASIGFLPIADITQKNGFEQWSELALKLTL
jgi:predicted NUDIX family phosphoesterase